LKVSGNVTGLKQAVLRQFEKLFERRAGVSDFVDAPLAIAMQDVALLSGRRVAVLADRGGAIDRVIVGDAASYAVPEALRRRVQPGRLNGLRLIVTTDGDGLSQFDLETMRLYSFDAVVAVLTDRPGNTPLVQPAWPLPPGAGLWETVEPAFPGRFVYQFNETVRDIEIQMRRAAAANRSLRGAVKARDAALLVIPVLGRGVDEEWEEREMRALCETAGVAVVDTVLQRRVSADPRYVIGEGKLRETAMLCLNRAADLIIFGSTLSPSQQRNIAEVAGLRVIDRNQLILDIFAKHAASVEGRLEVELAQLRYNLPRLSERDDSMSRLTGGIGALGPGETKLEMERRRARDRIAVLEARIAREASRRHLLRRRRRLGSIPMVAIAGYTNAGKSTLFNTLTGASVTARDNLFATLDPTVRTVWVPNGDSGMRVLVVDTVGFIRDLPAELEGAFGATLEEIAESGLVILVADASDPNCAVQVSSVRRILDERGYGSIPAVLALNKTDLLEPGAAGLLSRETGGIPICARDQDTLGPLLNIIARTFRES